MNGIPDDRVFVMDGKPHVFWVCKSTGHLRNGPVRTVRGEVVFVVLTPRDVVAVGVEELVRPPRFFTGATDEH